jgi:cytochrome c biogenesis protein CcmG, thiol:disulfide interchange protein DsbE
VIGIHRAPGRGSAVAPFALVALLALLVSCGGGPPKADPYTYDPSKAAVDVDSPSLRHDKAVAGIAACPASTAGAQQRDKGLPPITLPCLGGGRAVDLAGLRGSPTVLNFWAQTCGPCRQESPLFQRLHEAGDVRVLGVDFYDPLPSRAIAFARELGLTYPQIADPEAATRASLRVQGLPMTIFLDGDGRVRHVEYGAVRSAKDLATLVSTYLDVDAELG